METDRTDINRRRPPEVAATSLVAHDNDPSKNSNPEAEESRILILNATPGGAEDAEAADSKTAKASGGGGGQRGYVGLMNCVFAAQKAVSYAGADGKTDRTESRHRCLDTASGKHHDGAANFFAASCVPDGGNILAMERSRRIAAVFTRELPPPKGELTSRACTSPRHLSATNRSLSRLKMLSTSELSVSVITTWSTSASSAVCA